MNIVNNKFIVNQINKSNFDFNKDIIASQLFYLIKNEFTKNISKIIPNKIIKQKKNKDRIYDISHIIEHPVGMELIEKNIGKDITNHMKFHSKKTIKQLKQNFIGYLVK